MATDFPLSGNDILSFTFLFKPLLQLEGGQYFKKILFLLEKTGFFVFFQILIRMEVAFWASEIVFFKEPFILASGNGFSINYKLCAFIRSFFLLVDTILQIRCKPILFHFFYSWQRKQFSRLVETDFLSSGKSIFLFRALLKLLKFGADNFSFLRYSF